MLACPFCDFKDRNDYQLLLHVEIYHSENGDSPFAVRDEAEARNQARACHENDPSPIPSGASTPSQDEFVECPYKCGEHVPTSELQYHNDFHLAQEVAIDEPVTDITHTFSTNISTALRNYDNLESRTSEGARYGNNRVSSWKAWLSPDTGAERMKSKPGEVRRLSVSLYLKP
jgi:Ubiquitin-Binding Zinc Finger